MVDIRDILRQLNAWRVELRRSRERVQEGILDLALQSCHALVEINDVRSDTGVILQERVRTLYRNVASILDGHLEPDELEIVMNALASARIFYWIRFVGGEWSDELETLVRHRGRLYSSGQSSLTIVELAMMAVCRDEQPQQVLNEDALAALRRGCLSDFAKLEVLAAAHRPQP